MVNFFASPTADHISDIYCIMRRPTDNSEPTVGWEGGRDKTTKRKTPRAMEERDYQESAEWMDGPPHDGWFEMNQKYESLIEVGKEPSTYDIHSAVG